jgi:hypothetical protein
MLKFLIKKKFNTIIITTYILILLTVGAKSFDILFITHPKLSFVPFINFLRTVIPFILFFFFLGFIAWNYQLKKKIEIDLLLKIFFFFIVIQITGGINNPKNYENFYEYNIIFNTYSEKILIFLFIHFDQNYYLISLITIMTFFVIINSFFKNFKIENLLLVCVIIIALYNAPLIIMSYKNFLLTDQFSTYGTEATNPNAVFFNHSVPRTTGVSRSLLLIYILFAVYLLNSNKKKNTFFNFIFIILLSTLIWSFQSRAILFTKLIIDFLIIIGFWQNTFKKKIILFISIILLPIIIHNAIVIFKNKESYSLYKKYLSTVLENKNFDLNNELILNNNKILVNNRILIPNTSGRIGIWNTIIDKSKQSIFLGYGSQADRWYINRDEPSLNNASSALFYSLICGGIFGVMTYLLIVYTSAKVILTFLIKKFLFRNISFVTKASFFIIISILIRSIVENSFMLFSVDNIIFFTCYFILRKKIKKFH